jgi:hypothetical protein
MSRLGARSSVCGYGGIIGSVYVSFRAKIGDRARGNTAHAGIAGYIVHHHGIGADSCMVANLDPANYFGAGADINVIANHRATHLGAAILSTQGNPLRDVAVVADNDVVIHEDAAKMTYVETAPNAGITGYIDTVTDGVMVKEQYCQMAYPELAPRRRSRVRVEAQQHCIAEARHHQKPAAKCPAPQLTRVAPKVRGDQSPTFLPAHSRNII